MSSLSATEFGSVMEQERIEEAVKRARPKISVIGIGGAGSNIVSWIKERGMVGGKLVSVNTDANHLAMSKADRRILIGEKIAGGLGCGGYPEKGEAAMKENMEAVTKELEGSSIIFLAAGLGGGTGTGGICHLAESLSERSNALRVGVVTLPFTIEKVRLETAKQGIKRLRKTCDTVVAIDNTRLVKVAGGLPFQQALGVANELVGTFVKDITETITTASLINLDYADLRAIMEGRGLAAIGIGDGQGEGRIESAVKSALDAQLLDIDDVTKCFGVLIHVAGGPDVTLEEVVKAGELATRSLPPRARIIWGARVKPALNDSVHVMVVLTGVESAFLGEEPRVRFGPIKLY